MDLLIYGHTREWYNEFITKIFNYYNGRINKKFSAMIQINWINASNDPLGLFKPPGIVVINAGFIYERTGSEFIFVMNIIDTIIHELYHADQYVDTAYFNSIEEYEESVEVPVNRMSINYILSHTDEIIWISNGIINRDNIDYNYLSSRIKEGYVYNETDITRYIFQLLVDILRFEDRSIDVFGKLYYDIINNGDDLLLNIDEHFYTIICGGVITTDYNLINMYLRYALKDHDYRQFEIEIRNVGDSYMLIVNTTCENPMCEIIEEK